MDLGYFETSLPVKDIEASMAFYEALGFARAEYAAEAKTATMTRSDCRLGLFQGHLDPDRPQLIFWQGPVERIAEEAQRAGLTLFRPLKTDDEGGAAFMLEDPDGHPLFFIRMTTFNPQYPSDTRPAPAERPAPLPIEASFGWYQVSLPVADIARSIAFYEKLGFREVSSEANGRAVVLQNADCRVALLQGFLKPDRPQLIFWQGQVLALLEEVKAAGLDIFVGPLGNGVDDVAFMLVDPDGHPIYLIHMPDVQRREPGRAETVAA